MCIFIIALYNKTYKYNNIMVKKFPDMEEPAPSLKTKIAELILQNRDVNQSWDWTGPDLKSQAFFKQLIKFFYYIFFIILLLLYIYVF